MIPRTLLARIEADVAAAREHLDRATANLEAARRALEPAREAEPSTTRALSVKCGSCNEWMTNDEYRSHWRGCRRAAVSGRAVTA